MSYGRECTKVVQHALQECAPKRLTEFGSRKWYALRAVHRTCYNKSKLMSRELVRTYGKICYEIYSNECSNGGQRELNAGVNLSDF
jgi:hypothetical protein